VPVVWLSGPDLTGTSQLDFSHTNALADAAYTTSAHVLHSLAGASALPAGLYGGPQLVREDPQISDRIGNPERLGRPCSARPYDEVAARRGLQSRSDLWAVS
jgi:hypothetical protein